MDILITLFPISQIITDLYGLIDSQRLIINPYKLLINDGY